LASNERQQGDQFRLVFVEVHVVEPIEARSGVGYQAGD